MLALLPLLFKLIEYAPQIRTAVGGGTAAWTAISQLAPELLPILEQIGTMLFPELSGRDAQAAAGGMIFHYERTKQMQNDLNRLGATPPLEVDGEYGPLTKEAVTKFQQQHPPLEVDGWAGPQTTQAIANAIAALGQAHPIGLLCSKQGYESWLRESAQGDKWSFCLTADKIGPRIRREHEQETAPEPYISL